MSILSECPICHKKQSNKNRSCSCGADLLKAKKSNRVRYWISYRMPDGKQRRESVGFSIEEARDADGKRRGQKRENRIFDILPESKINFLELAEWYLKQPTVRKLKSIDRIQGALKNFNDILGSKKVCHIKLNDLETYQAERSDQGRAPATIDMEVKIMQTAVTKAFDNDKIDGRALKAFRRLKKQLKKGSNARTRTLTINEYLRLVDAAPPHLKGMIQIAFNTGMRAGEVRNLQWKNINRDTGFIRLDDDSTKEGKKKIIPINHHVEKILKEIPRALHCGNVITYNGKAIRQKDGFKRSMKSACENAGIPYGRKVDNGITFHDIRRTVKTNMANAGIDKAYRDTLLGHSLEGMDRHYIVPDEKALTEAMTQYTEWIDQKIEEEKAKLGQQMVNKL